MLIMSVHEFMILQSVSLFILNKLHAMCHSFFLTQIVFFISALCVFLAVFRMFFGECLKVLFAENLQDFC